MAVASGLLEVTTVAVFSFWTAELPKLLFYAAGVAVGAPTADLFSITWELLLITGLELVAAVPVAGISYYSSVLWTWDSERS